MLTVQFGEHLGGLAAECAQQRQLGGLHDGDVDAARAGARGDLQSDPAGSDDRERGAVAQ